MLYSEKLKPKLIKAGMRHIRNESAEEIACAQDMFETIFKDYKQEKDVHISGLLADLMHQKPVSEADFAALAGKILLILPDQDFFSGKMQQDLIKLMHDPQIAYVSGGHLSTVLKTDGYRALKHREEKALAVRAPLLTAAPARPCFSGETNSQSRKMFKAVLTMVETMTNTGAPSFRPKPCRVAARAEGIVKAVYQKR